jgi:plasmid stabilization system protein ParE
MIFKHGEVVTHTKAQLRHIHNYIAQDSPLYAGRVSEELAQKTIDLDELPRKGYKVPELNEDAVRELGALFLPDTLRDQT